MSDEISANPDSHPAEDAPQAVAAKPEGSRQTAGGGPADDLKGWLAIVSIGNAVALVLLLLIATVSMFLVIALRNDVSALEDQARKSAKALRAMQEELALFKERERLQAAPPKPAAPSRGAETRATNIDAADPGHDCVIRPGDKDGVAKCLR